MAEPLARPAFERLRAAQPIRAEGLTIAEHAAFGMASLSVRRGRRDGLGERLRLLGWPDPGPEAADHARKDALHGRIIADPGARTRVRSAAGGTRTLVPTGPAAWLALAEGQGSAWAMELAAQLEGVAGVADQSGAYGLLRLSGPRAAAALQSGAGIDLHAESFGPGAAAATVIAQVKLLLWRPDVASPDPSSPALASPIRASPGKESVPLPSFELAVPRSLAADFWHWLALAAADAPAIPLG